MRKAQTHTQIFLYIASAVLILLLLLLAFKILGSFQEKQRKAIVIELEEKLKSGIDLVSGDYGAARQTEVRVPLDTDMICFVDLSKRPELLKSTVAESYPEIKESLNDYVLKNMFFISKNKVTDLSYVGNICFNQPYYKCIETPEHMLKVLIKGRKDCADIIKPISSIKINNIKNTTRYKSNPIFVLQQPTDLAEMQTVMRLVPIAIWNNRAGIKSYPFYVFYEQDQQPAAEFLVDYLLQKHKASELHFFKAPPNSLVGHDNISYEAFTEANYRAYWTLMADVVVVDSENDNLVSALFASYIAAPLLYIDKDNLPVYKSYLNGTRVFIIDQVDADVYNYADTWASEVLEYDSKDLQDDPEINPYQQMVSKITPSIFVS